MRDSSLPRGQQLRELIQKKTSGAKPWGYMQIRAEAKISVNTEFDAIGGTHKFPICPVQSGLVQISLNTDLTDESGAEYLPGIGYLEFIHSLQPLNPSSADGEADDGWHIANAMHLVGAD